MKTLLLSAAAALALTGPVFADALGTATAIFAQSEDGGDGARYTGPTSHGDVAAVIEHFAMDRSGGDGPRVLVPSTDGMTLSTSNDSLAAYAAAKLANDERGYN